MANEMLKFRKGLFENLPEVSANTVGTIFVTTDEQAMYVDVASDKRIRISDFIRVSSVKDITPPYSTSSLYYVEADNALLKYVETTVEGVTTGTWKQVNGTDDLKDRIGAAETAIGTINSTLKTHGTDIKALQETVGKAAANGEEATGMVKDIEALKAAVGMNGEGEVEGLAGTVAGIRTDLNTLSGEVDAIEKRVKANETAIGTINSDIDALEKALADHETAADGKFATKIELAAAKSDVLGQTDGADFTGATINEKAYAGTVKGAFEAIADEKARAVAAEEANATAAAGALSAAEAAQRTADGKMSENQVDQKIADLKAENLWDVKGSADNVKTYADTTFATKDELGALQTTVAGHGTTLKEHATAIDDRVTKAELAGMNYATTANVATAKQEAIDAAATAAAGLYTTKTDFTGLQETVGGHDTKITALEEASKNHALKTDLDAYAKIKDIEDILGQIDIKGGLKDAIDNAVKAEEERAKKAEEANATAAAGALSAAQNAQKDATQALADAEAANNNANTRVLESDFTAFKITNSEAIAAAKKAGDDAQKDVDALEITVAGHTTALEKLNGDAKTEGSVANQIAGAKAELFDEIKREINVANSMEFISGVDSATSLAAIVEAKIGDTYVVTAPFNGYLPGDLLIAAGTEDEDTGKITAATLNWTHVQTGYDASLEQKLTVADNSTAQLTSFDNKANGTIKFVSDGSAATVSVAPVSDTNANPVVTIGMAWEDFE